MYITIYYPNNALQYVHHTLTRVPLEIAEIFRARFPPGTALGSVLCPRTLSYVMSGQMKNIQAAVMCTLKLCGNGEFFGLSDLYLVSFEI